MSSFDTYMSQLHDKLGSDWTWTEDLRRALWVIKHARGLWFEATYDCLFSEQEANVVAAALLDGVENGVKGRVYVVSGYDMEEVNGERVKKPWARVEPVKS